MVEEDACDVVTQREIKNNNVNVIDIDIDENQVNDEEEIQPPPPTCGICTIPMSADNVFNNNNRCMHPPYYCHNCIRFHLIHRIRFVTAQNIPCSDLNCTIKLDLMAFKTLISKEMFNK
ncbi:hypothetical protein Ahy_B02g057575 [Arachis hypogaea]|uniref:Uncharacterized protein n=1 Tax=Arachis hypogaea TaxID=3818 RepID=A0A445ACA3_ARAHY|nr:hypothetical protein Ahy_B02g057575 [Arachis hypogaea]